MKKVLSIILPLILLCSLVVAEGSSTATDTTNSADTTTASSDTATTANAQARVQTPSADVQARAYGDAARAANPSPCDDKTNRKDRIKCRLEAKTVVEKAKILDESCKDLVNPANCQSLYNRAQACYDKEGIEKDRCFLRVTGFIKKPSPSANAASNNEQRKQYAVLILYNLQQRVESLHQAGNITDEQAAALIDEIVQTKQEIQSGSTKDAIREHIQEIKRQWSALSL
ncbi:MAG TPA: hypothetical protein VJK51_02955 [Candidatus Nanoarchaeia archaeon]|nr:hypothetical protein [Candidatus Nanoarchaeia archaeon]